MNNDVIIGVGRKYDKITLDGQYIYLAYISIGLMKAGDFYVKIEFANLNDEKYVKVLELSKLEREIEIRSDIISNEKYDITHIVVEKFITSNGFEMSWECLSDKPKSSLSMED